MDNECTGKGRRILSTGHTHRLGKHFSPLSAVVKKSLTLDGRRSWEEEKEESRPWNGFEDPLATLALVVARRTDKRGEEKGEGKI